MTTLTGKSDVAGRTLARACGLWLTVYLAYFVAGIAGGPAWLLGILGWTAGLGLLVILVACAINGAYRRGGREADSWYDPRLRNVREQVHVMMLDEITRHRCSDPECNAEAARRGERIRELNDEVQSATFWGRSL